MERTSESLSWIVTIDDWFRSVIVIKTVTSTWRVGSARWMIQAPTAHMSFLHDGSRSNHGGRF